MLIWILKLYLPSILAHHSVIIAFLSFIRILFFIYYENNLYPRIGRNEL